MWESHPAAGYLSERVYCPRISEFPRISRISRISPAAVAFWLPALVFSASVWLLLRLSAQTDFTRGFLRTGAGALAFLASPAVRLTVMTVSVEHRWNPLVKIELYELLLTLALCFYYLSRTWQPPKWIVAFILLAHHSFVLYRFETYFFFGGFAAPTAIVAGLAWLRYQQQEIRGNSGTVWTAPHE